MPVNGMMLKKKKSLKLTIDVIVDNSVECYFCSSWNYCKSDSCSQDFKCIQLKTGNYLEHQYLGSIAKVPIEQPETKMNVEL